MDNDIYPTPKTCAGGQGFPVQKFGRFTIAVIFFYESEVVVCIETRNGIASVKNQRSSLCTGSVAKFPATGSSGSASDDG